MKYKVVVHLKNGTDETYEVDYYSHANCMLELFNYKPYETKIKLFPLVDIFNIDVTQIGA
jgi:hypothetical protein